MVPLATNTVHVVAPPETDLEATHLVFERFGEVAAVEVLADDPSRVSVAFFDVRSAARAVEALGSSYCTPGLQSGNRAVFMAADEQFQLEDFSGISDCRYDTANERYVIEFFDIRDAAKYETEAVLKEAASPWEDGVPAPPGLKPPPGLAEPAKVHGAKKHALHKLDGNEAAVASPPPGLVAPPGLEAAAPKPPAPKALASDECSMTCQEEPVCQVSVSGLPNKLLSDTMMEAVLQQAGLDACVTGFTLRSGKPVGEAIISFSSRMAAEHCVTHFQGCQWDQSGKGVTTRIMPSEQEKAAKQTAFRKGAAGLSAKASIWEPWHANSASALGFEHMGLDMSSPLAADVPGFQSMQQAEEHPAFNFSSTTLSAKAPEFVPGSQAAPPPSSDTSTEVGESEAEDEKGTNHQMLFANWQQNRPARSSAKEGVGTS